MNCGPGMKVGDRVQIVSVVGTCAGASNPGTIVAICDRWAWVAWDDDGRPETEWLADLSAASVAIGDGGVRPTQAKDW